MSRALTYVPPVLEPGNAMFAGFTTANWSGYHAKSSDNNNPDWFDASADNPDVQGEKLNDGHLIGHWLGFGGSYGSGTPLTQAGTFLNDNGSYNGQGSILFFVEWVNASGTCCNYQSITSIPISQSNEVYYEIDHGGNSTGFYGENYTTGKYTTTSFATNDAFSSSTVEWETEDASLSSSGPTHYNAEEYDSPTVYPTIGPSSELINLTHVTDWMGVPNGPYYMKPSAVQTDCCSRFYDVPQPGYN